MTCRTCSAEIDAKAIVCYRCGTPTATPAPPPGATRPARPGVAWVVVLVLAALAAAAYLAFWR